MKKNFRFSALHAISGLSNIFLDFGVLTLYSISQEQILIEQLEHSKLQVPNCNHSFDLLWL